MIVILHGWSDNARSFERLARQLELLGLASAVRPVYLGNYVSMDDDVSFDDIIRAMDRAWTAAGIPREPRSVDLIVHSTGGLVARYWMTEYFDPATNPVRRLLMLAPANFGSHLAHKGASFLGRVVKGYKSKRLFHTGEKILQGLELAGDFSTRLALVDRFSHHRHWYGPGRVLATVLVGTQGYSGIAAAANEAGSDGTVLVSTANLNPSLLELDFASIPARPEARFVSAAGATAFCRIPGENHSTIAFKEGGPANAQTLALVKQALTVEDDGFDEHCTRLAALSEQNRSAQAREPHAQGYQNVVLQVLDDCGKSVPDYFVELFVKRAKGNPEDSGATAAVQREIVGKVHVNRQNPAFRAMKVNCDRLIALLQRLQRPVFLSITASPEVRDTGSVGYSTVAYEDIGSWNMNACPDDDVFVPDRTLIVRLTIARQQVDTLVRFSEATRTDVGSG